MNTNSNLKIQVMVDDLPGSKGLPWADLENMPEFASYGDANQWLVDNGAIKLAQYGVNFRIVPKDTPCVATAMLERTVQ